MGASRLDLLLYCHDGRGLGHVSRSVAIGLAMRRLFPERRVLLVTGSRFVGELVGEGRLDWLKLPAYETEVVSGRSRGTVARSMFSDRELGELRGRQLIDIVRLYRPRVILADHTPQGKHRELVPAILESAGDSLWLLGVRGIVGRVKQSGSELAREIYRKYYRGLLWYGDSRVLGSDIPNNLGEQYQDEVIECGYVVRLAEGIDNTRVTRPNGDSHVLVSVPWCGEATPSFLLRLTEAMAELAARGEKLKFLFFLDTSGSEPGMEDVLRRIGRLENCRIERPGSGYAVALAEARLAVIYGGYNSLMDVIHCGVPALVALRAMEDGEQDMHLERLQAATGNLLETVREETVTGAELLRLLEQRLLYTGPTIPPVRTDGATAAAQYIEDLLLGDQRPI